MLAAPLKSQYTSIELKGCKVVRRHKDGNRWSCPGLPGYPVYFAEGDDRTFLSFGPEPEKRRAATQTLAAFNSVFAPKSKRTTIEWRISQSDKRTLPHATILRYFTDLDGRKGQVLVVSKVSPAEACHVARIDALANPDAIGLARRIADEIAPRFDCAREPTIEGNKGHSPM